jgi:hypothetical protein
LCVVLLVQSSGEVVVDNGGGGCGGCWLVPCYSIPFCLTYYSLTASTFVLTDFDTGCLIYVFFSFLSFLVTSCVCGLANVPFLEVGLCAT